MAISFGPNSSKLVNNSGGQVQSLPDQSVGGKLKFFLEQITLASQPSTDSVMVARVPVGSYLVGIVVESDTSLGSATIAFGDSNTNNRYASAATFTTTDTKVEVCKTAGFAQITSGYDQAGGAARNDYTDILMKIGTASLPSAGNLKVMTVYADFGA